MPTARKTVRLDVMLYHANFALRNPELSQDVKNGVCGMIETALHAANAYKGFRYMVVPNISSEEYSRQYFGEEFNRYA